jgi:hypothetical protein
LLNLKCSTFNLCLKKTIYDGTSGMAPITRFEVRKMLPHLRKHMRVNTGYYFEASVSKMMDINQLKFKTITSLTPPNKRTSFMR